VNTHTLYISSCCFLDSGVEPWKFVPAAQLTLKELGFLVGDWDVCWKAWGSCLEHVREVVEAMFGGV